jgi:hypothetical protein
VKVKVLRRKRARRRLRVRLSEPARVKIGVAKSRRGGGWTKVRTIRRRGRRGMNRLSLGKLRIRQGHRVIVRATDGAGNRSRRKVVRFRIKRR